MRKIVLTISSVLAILIFTSCCFAGFESGTSLANRWKEYKKKTLGQVGFNQSGVDFYTGYVEGIADSNDGVLFSIPGGVNAAQVPSTVGKYLEDHPSDLKKPADFLVTQALRVAYPLSGGE